MTERQHYRVTVAELNGNRTTTSIMARDAETARAAYENMGEVVTMIERAESKQYGVWFRSACGDMQFAEITALDEYDVRRMYDRVSRIELI